MEREPFQAGQRVVCIDSSGTTMVKEGELFTVARPCRKGDSGWASYVSPEGQEGRVIGLYARRFALYPLPTPPLDPLAQDMINDYLSDTQNA